MTDVQWREGEQTRQHSDINTLCDLICRLHRQIGNVYRYENAAGQDAVAAAKSQQQYDRLWDRILQFAETLGKLPARSPKDIIGKVKAFRIIMAEVSEHPSNEEVLLVSILDDIGRIENGTMRSM